MGRKVKAGAILIATLALAASCSSSDGSGSAPPSSSGGQSSSTAGSTPKSVGTSGTKRPPVSGAVPTVSGPVTGGNFGVPYNVMPKGLADQYGYTEQEYFISGSAEAYAPAGELGTDGKWGVEPAAKADYETRILVRRPANAADFNGTVLVEWLNVSAGRDADPDFGFLYPDLMDKGYAYVGVSAQATGVSGGATRLEIPGVPAVSLQPLKEWDPVRYAPLHHPGDEYSYDVYTQVARLLSRPGATDPLGGLPVEHVIAMGESQSAGRMATYANAIQPVKKAYDGIFIHSRGAAAAPLNADPAVKVPSGAAIRSDVGVPLFQFETETDLLRLGFLAARQPDSDFVRTWEVAGTAHADVSTLEYGSASGKVWIGDDAATYDPTAMCGQINDGPQAQVVRAGVSAFVDWVRDGKAMPTSPQLEIANGDTVVDETGNAKGGIRTPAVDAPVSVLSGKGNPSSIFCSIFGQKTPLTPEQLSARYATHDAYVAAVKASADEAVAKRFLLQADADAMVAAAKDAPIPS